MRRIELCRKVCTELYIFSFDFRLVGRYYRELYFKFLCLWNRTNSRSNVLVRHAIVDETTTKDMTVVIKENWFGQYSE